MKRIDELCPRILPSLYSLPGIRSPLHYIELFSQRIPSLLDDGQSPMIREISQSIHKSSREMNALLKDLLDYLRVNLYGQSLIFQEVNLSALVENKKSVFKNAVNEKANALYIDVPDSLSVVTDYQLLSIIIHNLIDNASKYTRKGTIAVTGERTNQSVILTITNNGAPLSEQLISDFNRIEDNHDSSMPKTKGNGLGLIIVKEIAHLLGISVSAAQTDVSIFTLEFPSDIGLKKSQNMS